MAKDYLDITDVAKLIRPVLAQAFPGSKFSVRTSRYSMGSSVTVSWTDGPSSRQVDAIIGRFSGKTFDGMTDSTHYHTTDLDGQAVQFPNYAPHTSRRVTDFPAWVARAEAMIRARCSLSDDGRRFGNDWVDTLASNMVHSCDFRRPDPLDAAFRWVIYREETPAAAPVGAK